MKIFKLLLLSVLFLSFSACGDDDEGVPDDTSGDLVGTWQLTEMQYSGTSSTTTQGITINTEYSGFAKDIDYSLTFSENPNNYESNGGYTIELTTTIEGQDFTQDVPVTGNEEGTWSLDGMELTITTNGESQTSNITVLNGSTLVFVSDATQTIVQGGSSTDADINLTATLVRQ